MDFLVFVEMLARTKGKDIGSNYTATPSPKLPGMACMSGPARFMPSTVPLRSALTWLDRVDWPISSMMAAACRRLTVSWSADPATCWSNNRRAAPTLALIALVGSIAQTSGGWRAKAGVCERAAGRFGV